LVIWKANLKIAPDSHACTPKSTPKKKKKMYLFPPLKAPEHALHRERGHIVSREHMFQRFHPPLAVRFVQSFKPEARASNQPKRKSGVLGVQLGDGQHAAKPHPLDLSLVL
jgi:hypothetical protein